jgi:hypothetical protein
MARRRSAAPARQKPKGITDSRPDLLDPEQIHAGRSEFDRQRHAVELPANIHYGRSVRIGELEGIP